MKIESAGICRASQRIYEKMIIDDVAPELTVAPYMSQEEGASPLPCRLYHIKGNEYVSVYPDLPIENTQYAIGAFGRDGSLSDSAIHAISFNKAKWESRKNYRLKPELCGQIRLYDEAHDELNPWGEIKLVQLFGRPDHIQCRIEVTLNGATADNLHITALNNKLEPIADSFTFLGERADELSDHLPAAVTSISASLDIPWDAQDTFIVASNGNRPGAFAQLFVPAYKWEEGVEATEKTICDSMLISPDYDKWFKEHRLTPYQASKQRACVFETMPLFSIIVPLYKTPIYLFDEMLGSLLAQTYQNWECILVNSTPEDEALTVRVSEAKASDSRIRVVTLQENLGISLNTNAGIAIAKGDFICFFDHDDTTEPDLLFEYVKEINSFPETDLLYCDEDKLSEDGVYCDPVFKIDYSQDLLRNNNYICHMLTIRKSLLEKLEPNTKDLDGAQDHSLTMQATSKARRVGHISRILYHWRKAPGSTASSGDAKPYAVNAGILAVQRHLQRMGENGSVASDSGQTIYKVNYDVPDGDPLVSILIVRKHPSSYLLRCLTSVLEKSTYQNYEVIVAENDACEKASGQLKAVYEHPRINTVRAEGRHSNFAELANYGRAQAKGGYILLLDDNTEVVTPDWIEKMLGNCARNDVGAVGVKLCYPDGVIQNAGIALGSAPWHAFRNIPREHWAPYYAKLQRNVSAVPASCCMVKAKDFDAIGGFAAEFSQALGSVDLCLKMQKLGKLIVYLPDVEMHRYEPISHGSGANKGYRADCDRELILLKRKWIDAFAKKDPYYSKGLPKKPANARL